MIHKTLYFMGFPGFMGGSYNIEIIKSNLGPNIHLVSILFFTLKIYENLDPSYHHRIVYRL